MESASFKHVCHECVYLILEKIWTVLFLFAEVATVTVGGVQTGDDSVFSTSVATAASIPEHVLVCN